MKYLLTAIAACALIAAAWRWDRQMTHDCSWLCAEDCRS